MFARHCLGLAAILGLFAPVSANAVVQTWSFTLTGYSAGGGALTGNFSGDAGADSILDLNELQTFSASWSGNAVVATPFTLARGDVSAFVYDTTVATFEGLEVTATAGTNDLYNVSGLCLPFCGRVSDGNGNDFAINNAGSITVAAAPGVPAPLAGIGLIPALAAFGGLGAVALRRRKPATA